MNELRERITGVILEIGEMDAIEWNDQTTFMGDLDFESIKSIELMVRLEEEFGISFGNIDEFLDKFNRINVFIDYVLNCIENKEEL